VLVLKQPIGVAAAITPWSFPAAMVTRKVGPALAACCTMIVKPSDKTPLTALHIARLFQEADLPPGVLNVVTGDAPVIASALLRRPEVRKLTFTGSTAVGRKLMLKASENIVRLSLELGGHAPFIVFADADLSDAVAGAIVAKLKNAGQTCTAPNRFYVHRDVYDEFLERLKSAVTRLRVGRGVDDDIDVGPLIDDEALAKVSRHVEDAVANGAEVVVGGRRLSVAGCSDRFYAPTILTGVTTNMQVMREETFGPVFPVRSFEDGEKVLDQANATPFGLAAYCYTERASRCLRVAEQLECGIVGINDPAPSAVHAPLGGVKQSGFGREGGRYALEEFVSEKYVSWGGL
jgi:succinate-semialdehyde dehydrogenase/glutarate-semialdehyde dehydrogenase